MNKHSALNIQVCSTHTKFLLVGEVEGSYAACRCVICRSDDNYRADV